MWVEVGVGAERQLVSIHCLIFSSGNFATYGFRDFAPWFVDSLLISLKIGLFRFQALGRKMQSNLALIGVFMLDYIIFCYERVFAFVVFDLVSIRDWLGENVSEMTYFVSHGT